MTLNDGYTYRDTVEPLVSGETLLSYLARRYTHSSEEQWRERIEAGRVLVDDRIVPEGTVLRRGQVLQWRRPPWREPEAPTDFAVLHRDGGVLAVAKPAGLPAQPGAGYVRNTLLARVRDRWPEAAPVHRLGRWTSGVSVFALSSAAAASLSRAWRSGQAVKLYRALASGSPAADAFTVDVPIGPVPHAVLGSVHGAFPGGRASRSHVRVLERRAAEFLAEVRIDTGRPHQIRIHLAAAGHPLAGDPLYGPGGVPPDGCRAVPGDPGYRLHAMEMRFRHPVAGRDLAVRCAPPTALRTSRERRR
jgi:23S rRNA pseudouridine1911/1915/1917 synthase